MNRDEQVIRQRQEAENEVGTFLAKAGINFAKRNWYIVLAWVVGLLIVAFADGFDAEPKALEEYFSLMERANDYETKHLADLEMKVYQADQRYYNSKGWFWTCNERCTANYNKLQQLKAKLADKETQVRG